MEDKDVGLWVPDSRELLLIEADDFEAELHHDLDHLAGTWSDEEAAEFDAALAEQRKIDPELWEE